MWDLRERLDHRWAAGSYLDFFLASAMMLLVFILGIGIGFQYNQVWYEENKELMQHIAYMLVAMGWMGAIMMAIGFDLLPFIHQSESYDVSILRMCIALNITGQIGLIIVTFTFDREIILAYGTVGVTLLALQFIVVVGPSWQVFKDRIGNRAEASGFGTFLPLMMPLIGVVALVSWVTVEAELSRELFKALLVDFFMTTVILAMFIGHFNRRLEWDIGSKYSTQRLFLIMMILGTIHVIGTWAQHTGRFTDPRIEYTLPLLYAVAFLGARPDGIWRNVLAKRPHSQLILAAHAWIITAIVMAMFEIRQGLEPNHARHVMLLGVGTMALWGFAFWMHDDHCHLPLDRGRAGWPFLIGMSLAIGFNVLASLDIIGVLNAPDWANSASLLSAMIGMGYLSVWWLWETLFHQGEWHRIPMYYGNMYEDADPYEFADEE
jgi:hypothetical protein